MNVRGEAMGVPLIHVVDDDESVRKAVARLLAIHGYQVRTHASASDYLGAPPEPDAACIVLDLSMPGPSGLDLQESLQRSPVPLPIVFVSGTTHVESGVRAMKAGAIDFLTKPFRQDQLLRAVEAAMAHYRAACERHDDVERVRRLRATLTPREGAVFERVVAGEPNKVIAIAMGITERTVKMHRAQVMAKMQAGSLAMLVQLAALLGDGST
jgi:FixJ family two-component response regulator